MSLSKLVAMPSSAPPDPGSSDQEVVPASGPANTTEAEALLRGAGLRVTAPRLAAIAALARLPHADAETVLGQARRQLGSVSHQGIYNVLAALTEAGIVRRIQPAASPALYELRVGDNHHHVVCRRCGATADVDCVVGRRPCLTPSDTSGYLVDEAEVIFWGLCPTCRHQGFGGAPGVAESASTENERTTMQRTLRRGDIP